MLSAIKSRSDPVIATLEAIGVGFHGEHICGATDISSALLYWPV